MELPYNRGNGWHYVHLYSIIINNLWYFRRSVCSSINTLEYVWNALIFKLIVTYLSLSIICYVRCYCMGVSIHTTLSLHFQNTLINRRKKQRKYLTAHFLARYRNLKLNEDMELNSCMSPNILKMVLNTTYSFTDLQNICIFLSPFVMECTCNNMMWWALSDKKHWASYNDFLN